MKGFSILIASVLSVFVFNCCHDPEIEAAKKRAEAKANAERDDLEKISSDQLKVGYEYFHKLESNLYINTHVSAPAGTPY